MRLEEEMITMGSIISKRMAELAMQCTHGDYEDTLRLAEARGIQSRQEENLIKFMPTSAPSGLASVQTVVGSMYDPATNFVSLGFAFFGMFWPQILDTDDVNELWKADMKTPKQPAPKKESLEKWM